MNIKELEKLMVERGISIRAIPKEYKEHWRISSYSEKEILRISKTENSTIILEDGKYINLVTKRPENGGKFIVAHNCRNGSMIRFSGDKYYDSIEDIIKILK